MLENGVLKENAGFGPVAKNLIDHRTLLEFYSLSGNENVGFAVGVIGGQALVVAVFIS